MFFFVIIAAFCRTGRPMFLFEETWARGAVEYGAAEQKVQGGRGHGGVDVVFFHSL